MKQQKIDSNKVGTDKFVLTNQHGRRLLHFEDSKSTKNIGSQPQTEFYQTKMSLFSNKSIGDGFQTVQAQQSRSEFDKLSPRNFLKRFKLKSQDKVLTQGGTLSPGEIMNGKNTFFSVEKEFEMQPSQTQQNFNFTSSLQTPTVERLLSPVSVFKNFHESNQKCELFQDLKQLPSPLCRISYSLAYNNGQQGFLMDANINNQKETLSNILSRAEQRKKLESKSQIRMKIKANNHQIDKRNEIKEFLMSRNAENKTIKTETPIIQDRDIKLIPPQFYMDLVKPDEDRQLIRPSFVEGAAMSVVGDKIFVYGGLGGNGIKNNLYEFNLKTLIWRDLPVQGTGAPIQGRSGHTVIQFKGNLVFFGGGTLFNKKTKRRDVFNDVFFYNWSNANWNHMKDMGTKPVARRNHKAVPYGKKYMLIFGGIDLNDKILSDIALYNLEKNQWKNLQFNETLAVAYHSMVNETHYEVSEDDVPLNWTKYPPDSIYCFGGKDQNSQPSNKLYKIIYHKVTELPDRWEEVKFTGIQPGPSYNNTISYYSRLKALVLIGGRKDELLHQNDSSVISDIYLFYTRYYQWLKVELKGYIQSMCSHSADFSGQHRIILFGGIGNERYLEPDITILEMDPTIVNVKNARDKFNYQKSQNNFQFENQVELSQLPSAKFQAWDNYVPQNSKFKKSLMERFKNWQDDQHGILSFWPVPQKKKPKIRYEIFIHFLKKFLKENQQLLQSFEPKEKKIKQKK